MSLQPSTHPQASTLETSPYICKMVCELCANYHADYQKFDTRIAKLIEDVKADLSRERNRHSEKLLEDLIFTRAFIAKKVCIDFCEAA